MVEVMKGPCEVLVDAGMGFLAGLDYLNFIKGSGCDEVVVCISCGCLDFTEELNSGAGNWEVSSMEISFGVASSCGCMCL